MPRKIRQRARPGDGSVFEKEPGKWCALISIGSGANRRRIAKFARTEAAALEALRKLRAEHAHFAPMDGEIPTLTLAIDRWLAQQKPRLREKTYVSYELTLRLHVVEADPSLSLTRLDRIRPAHIHELFRLLEKDRSARTRELVFLRLRSVFASYVGQGIMRTPVLPAHRPFVPRRTMLVWTQEEARKFLETTKDDEFASLYRVALSVGLRKGELRGLRWSDVDLKAGRLHIQHTLSDDSTALGEPKTSGSRRTIDLPTKAVEALAAQRKALLAKGLRAQPWVFPDETTGEAIVARKLSRKFNDAIERAKVTRIRFHDTRHTAATLMLAAGVSIKVVSSILGHAKSSITLDLYAHVLPGMGAEAAKRMDAIL